MIGGRGGLLLPAAALVEEGSGGGGGSNNNAANARVSFNQQRRNKRLSICTAMGGLKIVSSGSRFVLVVLPYPPTYLPTHLVVPCQESSYLPTHLILICMHTYMHTYTINRSSLLLGSSSSPLAGAAAASSRLLPPPPPPTFTEGDAGEEDEDGDSPMRDAHPEVGR